MERSAEKMLAEIEHALFPSVEDGNSSQDLFYVESNIHYPFVIHHDASDSLHVLSFLELKFPGLTFLCHYDVCAIKHHRLLFHAIPKKSRSNMNDLKTVKGDYDNETKIEMTEEVGGEGEASEGCDEEIDVESSEYRVMEYMRKSFVHPLAWHEMTSKRTSQTVEDMNSMSFGSLLGVDIATLYDHYYQSIHAVCSNSLLATLALPKNVLFHVKSLEDRLNLAILPCQSFHNQIFSLYRQESSSWKGETDLLSLDQGERDNSFENSYIALEDELSLDGEDNEEVDNELDNDNDGIENLSLPATLPTSMKDNLERWNEEYLQSNVKIVDFGNACWTYKHFTDDIQTREYRCPEVILGSNYDTSADIWSLACIIFEIATGDYLFDPRDGRNYGRDEDHLALMMELLGPMPRSLSSHGKYASDYFNRKGELRNIRNLKFWSLESVLMEKYHFNSQDASELASFLLPMLEVMDKSVYLL